MQRELEDINVKPSSRPKTTWKDSDDKDLYLNYFRRLVVVSQTEGGDSR